MSSPCGKCGGTERDRWGHCIPCHKASKDARYQANREKICADTQAWADANPDKKEEIGERSRLKKYGLTLEQYQALLLSQDGHCRICKEPFGPKIHIDHDHKTGVVRGLLCHNCNVGLGHFRDDPERLLEAAAYLQASAAQPSQERYTRLPFRAEDRRFKVTDEVKAKIQVLRGEGLSLGAVAKEVGLSRSWVQVVLREMH